MDGDEEIERRVRAGADATGVAYEVVACDPDLADTAQFCAAYGYELDESANCVVVKGKSEPPVFVACVVLATTRLDVNGVVRKRIGTRKASFAAAEEVVALTGMSIGGVTPFGLPEDIPLWVDARVMQRPRIVVGGGSRRCKVVGPPELLAKLGAEVVDGLAVDSA